MGDVDAGLQARLYRIAQAIVAREGYPGEKIMPRVGNHFSEMPSRIFDGPAYRFSIMPTPLHGVDMDTTMRFDFTEAGHYAKIGRTAHPLSEVKQVGPIATGGRVPAS